MNERIILEVTQELREWARRLEDVRVALLNTKGLLDSIDQATFRMQRKVETLHPGS